jgi:hypothetical protein
MVDATPDRLFLAALTADEDSNHGLINASVL